MDVAASADTKAMESLFEQLTRCKEDDQQRNWMLYEDESPISSMLQALSSALQNSDPRHGDFYPNPFSRENKIVLLLIPGCPATCWPASSTTTSTT